MHNPAATFGLMLVNSIAHLNGNFHVNSTHLKGNFCVNSTHLNGNFCAKSTTHVTDKFCVKSTTSNNALSLFSQLH